MNKLAALVLALALLLGVAALSEPVPVAETEASILRLTELTMAYVDENGMRSVRFEGSSLTAAIGVSQGAPTLQVNFANDNGQMVDGVVQLADREVLLSMGGISGTYAIDLQTFTGEDGSADDTVRSLTQVLQLAGSHLDVVLYAMTRDDGNGMRSVEVPLPMPQLISTAESLLSVTEGMEATQDVDLDELYQQVEALNDEAVLRFNYSPETGAFELSAIQNGRGMRLSGTMQLTNEMMTFINITDDEEKLDALNLTPMQLEDLRSELDMVLVKYGDFVTAVGLDNLMP